MSSDESDDEPLSVLASAKKENPEKFVDTSVTEDFEYAPKPKRRKAHKTKKSPFKKLAVTFKISRKLQEVSPTVIQRPTDVWLYLKDLNPVGPYSCLLCADWFVSKGKIIIHYILNHKKDFCGICRYFVPDREAWRAHLSFHAPWPCSQCTDSFPTDMELRQHLRSAHKLVHCRLCHFRVPEGDQYHIHLYQKHNVTNVSTKDDEPLWELEFDDSKTFLCFLCSKSDNLVTKFFNHYMGLHHFTLKCFASSLSGQDPPFLVSGVEVSPNFVESLKMQRKYGYVDLDKARIEDQEQMTAQDEALINEMEIKQENVSDSENDDEKNCENEELLKDENDGNDGDEKNDENEEEERKRQLELIRAYKGDEDFDVSLMELIIIQNSYFNYINKNLLDTNSKTMPITSSLEYEKTFLDVPKDVMCSLCNTKQNCLQTFLTHMQKMHCVKFVPGYFCRVCATTFDNQTELDTHHAEELGDFEDLWMCQFCDKEFDNREATRCHLTEHWEAIEYDNCFSPHLGFKCKYCPTLFWNENDREDHLVRIHYPKHKNDYYRCECSAMFSDKIWFVHHYIEKHQNPDTSQEKVLYLFKCHLCCIVLPTVEDMRNHFSVEHPEARKLFCSLDACQYKPLCHKKSFQLHLRSQHTTLLPKYRVYRCNMCGETFSNANVRNTHIAKLHGTGKYRCKICSDMLQSPDERKLHYLIRHPGMNPFECSECGKSFQYKSSLYMHKQEHSPVKKTYTCNYCQKVFVKKDSYREHVQIHEGPRHACSYCPMRFVQRSNMLRHERRHTGERPYACPHCPRTFADKGACNSHIRTHSKETSYSCVYCGQSFVQKSKLKYHIRKHTGENLETCQVCSKLFTSACALREHMKTHDAKTRSQKIKCPLCEREYQNERSMVRHLRCTHTHGRLPCPLCRQLLSSAANLRLHVLTHSTHNLYRCKKCPKSFAVRRTVVRHLRKKHSLTPSIVNIKDFYTVLDPRDCKLGLDEEVMNSIFGPRKKKDTNNLIGEISQTNTSNKTNDVKKSESEDDDDEEDSKASDSEHEDDEKNENESDSVNEQLEPTDFVCIKIEPMDDEETVNE